MGDSNFPNCKFGKEDISTVLVPVVAAGTRSIPNENPGFVLVCTHHCTRWYQSFLKY